MYETNIERTWVEYQLVYDAANCTASGTFSHLSYVLIL